jgi:hypothetical protein
MKAENTEISTGWEDWDDTPEQPSTSKGRENKEEKSKENASVATAGSSKVSRKTNERHVTFSPDVLMPSNNQQLPKTPVRRSKRIRERPSQEKHKVRLLTLKTLLEITRLDFKNLIKCFFSFL